MFLPVAMFEPGDRIVRTELPGSSKTFEQLAGSVRRSGIHDDDLVRPLRLGGQKRQQFAQAFPVGEDPYDNCDSLATVVD
jgi:hypothetical protein